jgi:hypothetical protein
VSCEIITFKKGCFPDFSKGGWRGRPGKWLWVFIVFSNVVVVDGDLKLFDAGKASPPDGLFGDFSEESLDQV